MTPEPYGPATPERRISGGEHDLLVGSHSQHFMRLNQRPRRKLFRSRARRSACRSIAADLIDLDRRHAASP